MNIKAFVTDLYKGFLDRLPSVDEILVWSRRYASGMKLHEITNSFLVSKEYLDKNKSKDLLFVPPGHFYSPVVDVNLPSLSDYCKYACPAPGIEMLPEGQLKTWDSLLPFLNTLAFNKNKTLGFRYFFNNCSFGIGDASIYGAILLKFNPKNIIEIGSGYSSACMLDVLDMISNENPPSVNFIEPYPDLLRQLLKPQDLSFVKIHESGVQKIPTTLFSSLKENDILFIDSTHILKTGSDVCWELFEILPSLNKGVLIHFHDIFWPFEYPNSWIFDEKRSWNEIYALKAFLMFNKDFKIEFFNDYFSQKFNQRISQDYPKIQSNTGGSLWIRKVH